MSLAQKKLDNYNFLNGVFADLEGELLGRVGYLFSRMGTAREIVKTSIINHYELDVALKKLANAAPDFFQETDTGYSVTMIDPESKNEDDPIKDTLKLNTIEDLLWAKGVVGKAFLELVSGKEN